MNTSSAPTRSIPVSGRYYDGRCARAYPVRALFLPGPTLALQGAGIDLRYSGTDIALQSAVADAPRTLFLPDGQSCEISDLDALDSALGAWPEGIAPPRRRFTWKHGLGGLLALALLVWLTITLAVPFAAQRVAFMLPASTTDSIGEDSLRQMDQTLFEPSRLPYERRQALLRRSQSFLALVNETSAKRIEFRHAPSIGANAMAFPSGTIVFTDDLVRLSTNDEQLLAVLAHEAGHVHHRHGLRGILQSSAVTLAITLLIGEERTSDSLQSALTANLINSRYSREFEYEADAHAKLLLGRANVPASRLGEILDMMENEHGHDGGESYLDSHPSTPDRKRRLAED